MAMDWPIAPAAPNRAIFEVMGVSKIAYNGDMGPYLFDKETTDVSRRRIFEFQAKGSRAK
jgi:hypothetical protein